jgi:hypothetical protein
MNNFIEKYNHIIVNRKGLNNESFMITTNIIDEIIPHFFYKVDSNGLNISYNNFIIKNINIHIPKYLEFTGKWLTEEHIHIDKDDANILGSFGKFEIDLNEMNIPIQDASQENLMYYNVKLLKIGDNIKFETNDYLPLCIVNIGEKYVNDYILQEKYGGGVYLEYHKNPHFHMPIYSDSNGGLILAKKISDNNYHISCFKIPFGYATYIPPYVIHNDCFLIGKYYVIYSKSEPFSTCLLRNKENKIINVKII